MYVKVFCFVKGHSDLMNAVEKWSLNITFRRQVLNVPYIKGEGNVYQFVHDSGGAAATVYVCTAQGSPTRGPPEARVGLLSVLALPELMTSNPSACRSVAQ